MIPNPDKPHLLPCPYKPPLEREKLDRELYVDTGKRYMATWNGKENVCREVSKEEFDAVMLDMLKPDPLAYLRRPAWDCGPQWEH